MSEDEAAELRRMVENYPFAAPGDLVRQLLMDHPISHFEKWARMQIIVSDEVIDDLRAEIDRLRAALADADDEIKRLREMVVSLQQHRDSELRRDFVAHYEFKQAILDLWQAMTNEGIRGPQSRIAEMFGVNTSRVQQIVLQAQRQRRTIGGQG